MTDIQLTCPACGRQNAVAEFVEDRVVTCQACGQPLPLPERKPEKTGLKLKWREPLHPRKQAVPVDASAPAAGMSAVPLPSQWRSMSVARDIHRVKAHALKVRLSWLFFLALAGGLVFIRFFGGWPGMPLETLKGYGMLAIAAAYLFVVVLALRDNMFDGLLAIVIPLYPFYYLFFSSSAVFTRALVGALLVAFGYDTLLYLQGWAVVVSDAVNRWIQNMTGRSLST